jgi:rhamnosyltransferase
MTAARVRLAAGIVAYEPDPTLLAALVRSLLRQADLVLVYRNSGVPPLLSGPGECQDRLVVLGDERNLGLGVAHNRIVEAAMARGIERILLLDQDSTPSGDLAGRLLKRMQGLIGLGARPAVVGPRPVDLDGTAYRTPRMLKDPAPRGCNVPVEFLIASGSLIDGSAFRRVGAFREDFFIDAIDLEWCLRARAMGFTCWMATDVAMEHRLGAGIMRLPWVDLHLVRQPPLRAYTFVRNQFFLFRLTHIPWRWKARALVRLAIYTIGQLVAASQRRATARLLARGWWDGLRGHLGPP